MDTIPVAIFSILMFNYLIFAYKLFFSNNWINLTYKLNIKFGSKLYTILDLAYTNISSFLIIIASQYLYFEYFWYGFSLIFFVLFSIIIIILILSCFIKHPDSNAPIHNYEEYKSNQKQKLFKTLPFKIIGKLLMIFSWNKYFLLFDIKFNTTLELIIVILLYIITFSYIIINLRKAFINKNVSLKNVL